MNIHEYQGKEILRQYGVTVPEGRVAFTVDEAVKLPRNWAPLCTSSRHRSMQEVAAKREESKSPKIWTKCVPTQKNCWEKSLVTHQTGPEGKKLNACLLKKAAISKRNIISDLCLTAPRTRRHDGFGRRRNGD